MRHGVRVARRRCRSDHRRQGPPEVARHRCRRDAKRLRCPLATPLLRNQELSHVGGRARSAERLTPLDVRRREHGTQLFRTAQTSTVLGDMIQDRQHTRRVGGGRTVELSGSGARQRIRSPRRHSRASKVHMASASGMTASPARTQNVQAPCNLVGSRCVRSRLRSLTTANAAGCAARTRATSSWPRSAARRGRRDQRASGALGRRWRLDAREAHHRFATVDAQ